MFFEAGPVRHLGIKFQRLPGHHYDVVFVEDRDRTSNRASETLAIVAMADEASNRITSQFDRDGLAGTLRFQGHYGPFLVEADWHV